MEKEGKIEGYVQGLGMLEITKDLLECRKGEHKRTMNEQRLCSGQGR